MRHTNAIVFLGVLLAIAGCATARVQGAAQPLPTGGQAVTIEMSGFNFIPNVVALQAGS